MKHDQRWIVDGQLVLPDRVITGSILVRDGKIITIIEGSPKPEDCADIPMLSANGYQIMPGLIDLHCDALEKEIEPRPNTLFPFAMAFGEYEKRLAACGITHMYHSLSLGVGLSLRGTDLTLDLIDLIDRKRRQPAMIRHRVHLRYEVTFFDGLPHLHNMLQAGKIDYMSIMNHAPGIGQYRKPGAFERYVMKNQGVNREEVQPIIDNVLARQQEIDWSAISAICQEAAQLGIAVASHDDESAEQVRVSASLGAHISEFPITPEAAEAAAQMDMQVCVGAPNLIRGGSHDGNLRAIDAISAGHAKLICSDYLPSSLLHAIFQLESSGIPLYEAVRMATHYPAQAMGIATDHGSLEVGKQADLIWVHAGDADRPPAVMKTMVGGNIVYRAAFTDHAIC